MKMGISYLLPDSQLFSKSPGWITSQRGSRLVLNQCKVVTHYEVAWDRSFKQDGATKCSVDLPILIGDQLRFLHLPTKQLQNGSALRKCDDNSFLFVEGKNDTLFKISSKGSVKLDIHSEPIFKAIDSIPQLSEIDFSNKHRQDNKVSVPVLLRMLSENREQARMRCRRGPQDQSISFVQTKHKRGYNQSTQRNVAIPNRGFTQ